ncbi:thioredoxin family protein [Thalassotalea fusca]
MKVLATIFILFSQMTWAAVNLDTLNASLPLYSKVYDDKRDPFADAKDAISLANRTGRNVIIEIGGNWCTWCHKMDAFLAENPDIYQLLHQKYVLLKINVSDSNENEAFMKGLPPVLGYPHMYVSTGQGKMLLSKDTADFLTNGQYSREAWLSFLNKWQASSELVLPVTPNVNKAN